MSTPTGRDADIFATPTAPPDAATLAAVAAAFGLGEIATITRETGVNTAATRLTGAGFDVVARTNRPWVTPDRLRSVHEVQRALASAGLPVPIPRRALSGEHWVTVGNALVEVSDYVPGGDQASSAADVLASAHMLGRFHAAVARLDPALLVPPAHTLYADTGRALPMLALTEERLRATGLLADPAIASTIRRTRGILDRIAATEAQSVAPLPATIVHGDYCGRNVLLRDGAVIAILDFDRLAVRPSVTDLGFCLFHARGRIHASPDDAPETPLSPDFCDWVAGCVRAWESGRGGPLSATELARLPAEMARATLFPIVSAGHGVGVIPVDEIAGELLRATRAVATAARIMADAPRIVAALAG